MLIIFTMCSLTDTIADARDELFYGFAILNGTRFVISTIDRTCDAGYSVSVAAVLAVTM